MESESNRAILVVSHEDAEGVSCGVGVDPQRFLRVVGTVAKQPGAKAQGSLVLGLELLHVRDGQIEVELLRDWAFRPRGRRKFGDLLEEAWSLRSGELTRERTPRTAARRRRSV